LELREGLLSQALQLRSELLAQERQLRNEFLSHVSHELRSPLTAIYQFTTILLDGLAGELNDDQREYLAIALRNVKQLQTMIDDLLTASRARAGGLGVRPERVALEAAVREAFAALADLFSAKEISYSVEVAEGLPLAYADPALLQQILIHLLHNSIKFTPLGGTVVARLGPLDGEPNRLLVQIEDSGCGIDPERLATLFERIPALGDSSAAPRQGLGLGLFICHELVHRLGGLIGATSTPGQGSRFFFTVPAFSLGPVIAPVVDQPLRRPESLSLVIVDACATEGAATPAELGAAVSRARGILEQRLVPGFEVLVPGLDESPPSSSIFVVAAVEQNSGQSAVDRMREHLERAEALRGTGLRFSVSNLDLEPLPATVLAEDRLASLAARVEGHVRGTRGPQEGGARD
jgi:hypothetical protein